MNVLFALNQNSDKCIEDKIFQIYKEETNQIFKYEKEFDLTGVIKQLKFNQFDFIVINELLERQNTVTTDFIDDITDKYPNLKIIFIIDSEEHEQDNYVKKLFNIGIYNIVYSQDVSIEILVQLLINQRTKAEAKIYLNLSDVEDVVVENELDYIPEGEMENIIKYISIIEKDKIEEVFEHICNQYNEKQISYLIDLLPEDVIKILKKNNNRHFEKYNINNINSHNHNIIQQDVETETNLRKILMQTKTKKVEKGKPNIITKKEVIIEEKINGTVIISVATAQRGAGSTYHTISIANYLSSLNKKVAVIEISENRGLYSLKTSEETGYKFNICSKGSISKIDIYPNNSQLELSQKRIIELCNSQEYDYIVCDFGAIISKDENNNFIKHKYYDEFIRANFKVIITFPDIWHKVTLLEAYKIPGLGSSNFPLLINYSQGDNIDKDAENIFALPYNPEVFILTEEQKELYKKILAPILAQEKIKSKRGFISRIFK